LKSRVLEQLEKVTSQQPEELRPLTRDFAARLADSSTALNSAAWTIVSVPKQPPDRYQAALALAERAYELDPDPATLNTLGVAQYRAGQFASALVTLEKSRRLNREGPNAAQDVAFIAMSQFRLGRTADARRSLQRLRAGVKEPGEESESNRFLREATELIAP
jgi:tetratricopeptide (TPR) repeat protein